METGNKQYKINDGYAHAHVSILEVPLLAT